MSHSAEEYRAFTGSLETRMVFALGPSGVIEYMPENAAPEFKERRKAGAKFSCLVPDCESPTLTVVDRGIRRHGFSHVTGGGHDGVGVAHLQCQLLIQHWLSTRYPSLQVDLEMTTADGRRRADVMATSPSSGAQIAFEVQYASMTPAEWQARHDSYRELGIVDVWLWGYGGAQFHTSKLSPGWVTSNPTLATVGAAGQTILFIDPAFEHIGYATCDAQPFELPGMRILSTSGSGHLQSEALTEFRIDPERQLMTNQLAELHRMPERVRTILEHRHRERDERERRRREAREGFYNRVRTKSEARERTWPETPEYKQILNLFGLVPDFLNHVPISGKTTIHLPIPPMVWQGTFYLRYIHRRRDGWRVSIRGMVQDLEEMDADVRFPEEAVRSWLGVLEDQGHVARLASSYRYEKWPKFEVRATPEPDGVSSGVQGR